MMARAIELAQRGLYTTDPNPRVGCVLVNQGKIVGQGYHIQAGCAHAEVNALLQAREQAKGATAYVTLEPCSHVGRTPPCCQSLIRAGIARVVVAMLDPYPEVAGQGLQQLKAAGIEVTVGVLEAEARALNPGYLYRLEKGRPLVRVKLAMSLDGRTALANGESQWITGPDARLDVQKLRARSSAVVTGINTVLMDNAKLTVRPHTWSEPYPSVPNAYYQEKVESAECFVRQPLRVVLDSRLRMPVDHPMLNEIGCVTVVCSDRVSDSEQKMFSQASGAKVVSLAESEQGGIDLTALLDRLSQLGCNEVLVEAGPNLAGAFVKAGLVDELWIYCGPKLLGHEGRPLVQLDVSTLLQAPQWIVHDIKKVGYDVCIVLLSVTSTGNSTF